MLSSLSQPIGALSSQLNACIVRLEEPDSAGLGLSVAIGDGGARLCVGAAGAVVRSASTVRRQGADAAPDRMGPARHPAQEEEEEELMRAIGECEWKDALMHESASSMEQGKESEHSQEMEVKWVSDENDSDLHSHSKE